MEVQSAREAVVAAEDAPAAGLAVGFWEDQDELRERWAEDKRWEPYMDDEARQQGYARWKKAVERTLNWVDVD